MGWAKAVEIRSAEVPQQAGPRVEMIAPPLAASRSAAVACSAGAAELAAEIRRAVVACHQAAEARSAASRSAVVACSVRVVELAAEIRQAVVECLQVVEARAAAPGAVAHRLAVAARCARAVKRRRAVATHCRQGAELLSAAATFPSGLRERATVSLAVAVGDFDCMALSAQASFGRLGALHRREYANRPDSAGSREACRSGISGGPKS